MSFVNNKKKVETMIKEKYHAFIDESNSNNLFARNSKKLYLNHYHRNQNIKNSLGQ